MDKIMSAIMGAASLVLASLAIPGAAAKPYLYVENGESGDVSVISIPEHEVVSLIKVGDHPDDLIGSPDGKILYVNRAIVKDHKLNRAEEGEIVAVSTKTEEVLWRMKLDAWPHHLSISDDGQYLYVPLFDRPYVAVIDLNKRKVDHLLDGSWGMHGTRLSPDGKRLYAGAIFTDTMFVFDLVKRELIKAIPFLHGVRPFAFTRDEKTLYTQISGLHGFQVVNLETEEIEQTVHMPGLPDDFKIPPYPHSVNHGLELSPDEKYLFAAGSVIDKLAVYSVPDLELKAFIDVCGEGNWVVFSPDGKYAYLSCRDSNEVSVISVETLEEIKRIPTQGEYSSRMRIVDVPERD